MELGPAQLVPRLMAGPESPNGLPTGYITELVSRFADDGFDMVMITVLEVTPVAVWFVKVTSSIDSRARVGNDLCSS